MPGLTLHRRLAIWFPGPPTLLGQRTPTARYAAFAAATRNKLFARSPAAPDLPVYNFENLQMIWPSTARYRISHG
jgi:hypothetical protein